MFFVTAASARSAGASYGQVQATILVNNGNVQIGPKVKVSVKFSRNISYNHNNNKGTSKKDIFISVSKSSSKAMYSDASLCM